MRAFYSAHKSKFVLDTNEQILGELAQANHFPLDINQKNAWIEEINILKDELKNIEDFTIFIEFTIPRMGKRVDAIIVISNLIFVIEFKVGSNSFENYAIEQVEDYALDLKNFHEGSHNLTIIPILIATKSKKSKFIQLEMPIGQVFKPLLICKEDLSTALKLICSNSDQQKFDAMQWSERGYRPTPTIIEAARSLYAKHNVADITRSDSGAANLSSTQNEVERIIEFSKNNLLKSIVFITGVPGAGKTLAGLNIATSRFDSVRSNHATFLSGNGPLVEVLKEALIRDEHSRLGVTKSIAQNKVRGFIQNIHKFRDEYASNFNIPSDHIVIFDEAQRAWNKSQTSNFMQRKRGILNFEMSEPEFLISVMDRRKDWCTIICLIGGGQEINTGEAGLSEWIDALNNHFKDWHVFASSNIVQQEYDLNNNSKAAITSGRVKTLDNLHLNVSLRSFRAETVSRYVSLVLDGDKNLANEELRNFIGNYPIYITRELVLAKKWIREKARGSERYGILASSGANRLKPEGINVKVEIDPVNWFLNDKSDVRSSYYLEDAATEFHVQGLELDWAIVCWDANLRRINNQWNYYDFKGTKWQSVNDRFRQIYLKNSYRVLLTRARQGQIIFIPKGDVLDGTRVPEFYDETFQYLLDCGLVEIIS